MPMHVVSDGQEGRRKELDQREVRCRLLEVLAVFRAVFLQQMDNMQGYFMCRQAPVKGCSSLSWPRLVSCRHAGMMQASLHESAQKQARLSAIPA